MRTSTGPSPPPALERARTYILDEGPDAAFGLDEIILTMKSDEAARKFVANLRTTVEKCPKRKLTAVRAFAEVHLRLGCGGKEG